MRPSLAPFLPLLALVACSRALAAPEPPTDASSTPSAADAATDAARTNGVADARAPRACLGHRVEWKDVGGMMGAHDEHSITGCRTYRVKLAPDLNDPVRAPRKSCTRELPVAAAPTLDDLALAITDPVVTEAFVRGGMAGDSRTRYDGTDLDVTLDGKRLVVGQGVPAALEKLTQVLYDVGNREVERCRQDGAGVKQGDASAPRR